ncbi:glycosyltransferase [Criibacterium bergeronii]|uniref:Glycosyltransferase n=1 Tax=Criibacterium bergeronii TaxID=1871336 RepID=A0A371INQ5_9FIRM|nr:glycosyltransferase [Criibacterium bergeronii]RDY22109.1 glycosyltransferase [Criibacterium bergeronii]
MEIINMEGLKNPVPETWDKVAENYTLELAEGEKKLALEILNIIQTMGLEKGARILELGCGSGHLSAFLSLNGYKVDLLDFSEKAIEKAKKTFKFYKLEANFFQADMMNLPKFENSYDLIWNSGVMEHFTSQDLSVMAKEFSSKFNCPYLCIVPNPKSLPYLLYRFNMIEKGLWNVGKEYLRKDYAKLFMQNGYNLLDVFYLGDSYTVEWFKSSGKSSELEYVASNFEKMLKNGLIPEEEKYLVAYLFKIEETVAENKMVNNTELESSFFDLVATFNAVRNEYISDKNKLDANLNNLSNQLENKNNIINQKNDEIIEKAKIINNNNEIIEEFKSSFNDIELENKSLKDKLQNNEKLSNVLEQFINESNLNLPVYNEILNGYDFKSVDASDEFSLKMYFKEYINQIIHLLAQNKYLNEEIVLEENKILNAANSIKLLSQTKPYKLAHLLRKFKFQYLKGSKEEKNEFKTWLYSKLCKKDCYSTFEDGHFTIYSVIDILENKKKIKDASENDCVIKEKNHAAEKLQTDFDGYVKSIKQSYAISLYEESDEIYKTICDKISEKNSGIIVYPPAVHWQPIQRTQHILREFARNGFIAIFCETNVQDNNYFREEEKNLFVSNCPELVLKAIKRKSVIVLCTWAVQLSFINLLDNPIIWYDILDKIDFFSMYDNAYKNSHDKLVKYAHILSYSSKLLEKYTNKRKDALYLPNAVNVEDFMKNKSAKNEFIKEIKNKYDNIIGYYGAVEKWFDQNLLYELAKKHTKWAFVIIGYVGVDIEKLKKLNNIYFVGKIPYEKLSGYANYFDVAIIPFIVNDLTNCVSPVKFFEYSALGKPVVSTNISEMLCYESDIVKIANSPMEFDKALTQVLQLSQDYVASKAKELAEKNTWAKRVKAVLYKIDSEIMLYSLFSNPNDKKDIAIFTETFTSFDGQKFFAGGAERYLIDLVQVCNELGLNAKIYQYGKYPWFRKIYGLDVESLYYKGANCDDISMTSIQKFNREFFLETYKKSKLCIYSPFFLTNPKTVSPNIGISHGICWDSKYNNWKGYTQFQNNNSRFIYGAKNVESIVSVDTNTANWLQTIDFETSKRVRVIPNYVDIDEFNPKNKTLNSNKIVITYPRRLYEARGLYLVLDIIDDILDNYENVEFHFVGRGFPEDTYNVENKIKKWGDRIKWYFLLPDEMPKVYQYSDIILIPTLYSEGTSLSCLEAMASGNAIIATRVGGLTDLIIDDYNGKLIGLNPDDLKKALIDLIENKDKREFYGTNARAIALSFSKEKWKNNWKEVIKAIINEKKSISHEVIKTKYLIVYINNFKQIDNNNLKRVIKEKLLDDYLVEIRCENIDDESIIKNSFGRLQFLKKDAELLSMPDCILYEKTMEDFVKGNKLFEDVEKKSMIL